mgnify:CR=1 FL=1
MHYLERKIIYLLNVYNNYFINISSVIILLLSHITEYINIKSIYTYNFIFIFYSPFFIITLIILILKKHSVDFFIISMFFNSV